jgi:hypothetical protein
MYYNLKGDNMKFCILLLGILIQLLITQTGIYSQTAVPATGGNISDIGGTVSFTVGEVVYTKISNNNGIVSQGVQQTYEILDVGIEDNANENISLSVFPNPSANELNLQINGSDYSNYSFQLSDLQGKILESGNISSNRTLLNLTDYPSAPYFIKILQENKVVKNFKIIKR